MEPEVQAKVEAFLKNVKQIPTLPDVYLKVKKAFDDPSISVEYLSDAIRFDQSLTISILRLANSPLFGFRQKISSINQAVMLIGLREVYSLVLSVSVMGLFPLKDSPEALFPTRSFWEHSLAVALTARMFASAMGYKQPEDLFVAGLIHDIGKLIEKMYLGDQFEQMCQRARSEAKPLWEIEKEELGFTHAEIGTLLTKEWQFPDQLIYSTAYHHDPNQIEGDEIVKTFTSMVHLADSLVRALGIGWSGDPYVTHVDNDVLKRLHLIPFSDLSVLTGRIRHEYDGVVKTLLGDG